MTRSKISNKTIFSSLLIISVVLLFIPRRHTRILIDTFTRLTNPLLSKGPKTAQGFLTLEFLNSDQKPDQDLNKLQKEYRDLKAAYSNAIADNRTAQQQLDKLATVKTTFPQPGPGLVFAQVTNASLNGTSKQLMINKGLINKGVSSGIKKGQYVLAKNNIIGTISDVTQSTAKIQFVTDAAHKIEIFIMREENTPPIPGLLFGQGTDACKIPLLDRKNDISFGDLVYAAPKQGKLYTPRVIGTISMVQDSDTEPLLLDISVRPINPAHQITEVAVIVMEPDIFDGI